MNEQYDILLKKLDKFIRKYYKNQLIKGLLYCIALLIVFFISVNLIEYLGHFNIGVRTFIFYTYIVLNVFIIGKFIVIPLFKLYKIWKIISNEYAAKIIGDHFAEVKDKLINTLQLSELIDNKSANIALVNASIEQKIKELRPVPFTSAINLSDNKKYLKFALPPLLLLLIIFIAAPSLITEPTTRLVKHTEHFEKAIPFQIKIKNDNLEVVQNEDFKLKIKIVGEEIPEKVYMESGNNRIKLEKENTTNFSYNFINVQRSFEFQLIADEFKSNIHKLKVLPKPIILDFEINLDYPSYTRKKDEIVSNNGDLIIPKGTIVNWKFFTKNTDDVILRISDSTYLIESSGSNAFVYENTILESQPYTIFTKNEFLINTDSLNYSINIIPDLYPFIIAEEYRDSIFEKRLYFKGVVKDDYGFDLLTFNYMIKDDEDNVKNSLATNLSLKNDANPQQFFHFFNLDEIDLTPGGEIEYYFEIWDNDRINGSKSTRTQTMTFRLPSQKEIDKKTEESNKAIKDEMEEALKEVQQLQKDIEELNKKMLDKKELNWEDKQQIQELLNKHNELQKKMESIKKENEEKARKEQQYKDVNEEIIEKQKQLEELFNKLMEDEELKKLFDELQELLEEVDKDKVNEMMEKMKLSSEELENMLDRNLELFKQLEFEQKLEETIKKLDELSKKQEELSEETLDKKNQQEDLKSEQEKINEEFEDVKKTLDELDKMNEELEDSNDFDKMEEKQEDIDKDLDDSKSSLEKDQRKNASKSQKGASQKMQQMSQSLFDMQQQMVEEGMGEDIDMMREILENLIQLSFDQEDLIGKVSEINLNDPQYTDLVQEQMKIKDDLVMVEDSLIALSKRQIMIEPFITKEINIINQNVENSVEYLNNRRTKQAAGKQQYVMTSINNLALMLSETLNQMMMSMMQLSSCSGSCKSGKPKPGSGQGSMKSMRQLQEQLNKQIESLKKGKKPGKKDGGEKPGGKMGQDGQSMSEQLARAAAQQEAIRNQMRQYSEMLDKNGQFGASKELKKMMEDMEKTETDLVNKMVTQETLMRQKQILTRLLKSEKAELEREKEEKRESNEAKNINYRNPEDLIEYNRQLSNEVELLKTMPPGLKPFYESKVNQYFINFEELLKQ